ASGEIQCSKHSGVGLKIRLSSGFSFMPGRLTGSHACPGFRRMSNISRREALRIGGLFSLGLTLPQLLAAQAQGDQTNGDQAKGGPSNGTPVQSRSFGSAKRVIMLYLHGGHPPQ